MVRIIADTTAGMDPAWGEKHGVPIIPQVIMFGEESFLEMYEISYAEFMHRLRTSPVLPKTAAPPPGLFIKAFQDLQAEKNTIICVLPSSDVSGTVRSAITAKAESYPDADIRIIDTRTIAGQLTFLVQKAVEWMEAGLSADEIEGRIRAMMQVSRTIFVVDTLEYLQKGGRIGGAAALVGQLLQVKPIFTLVDGHIEALARERTTKRAMARFKELVMEDLTTDVSPCLQIMHTGDPARAQELVDFFKEKLGRDDFLLINLVPAIVTHAGPGTLAVGFLAREGAASQP